MINALPDPAYLQRLADQAVNLAARCITPTARRAYQSSARELFGQAARASAQPSDTPRPGGGR